MKIPFTTAQFFQVMADYNNSVYPAQIILLILGILCLVLVHLKNKKKACTRVIGLTLSGYWLWMGLVYHISFFSTINKAALVFGLFFVLQGVLLAFETLRESSQVYDTRNDFRGILGEFFILFGLFLYPLIGLYLNPSLEKIISPGLPCPTTILTFGFFLLANNSFRKYLLVIPVFWSLVGTMAAFRFGVVQDYFLIISALSALYFLLWGRKAQATDVNTGEEAIHL